MIKVLLNTLVINCIVIFAVGVFNLNIVLYMNNFTSKGCVCYIILLEWCVGIVFFSQSVWGIFNHEFLRDDSGYPKMLLSSSLSVIFLCLLRAYSFLKYT